MKIGNAIKPSKNVLLSILAFAWRHWYFVVLVLLIIPSVITSIQVAVETKNPTYPFFDLATRILVADQALDKDVDILRTNPSELIGMDKPTNGIWDTTKYYWLLFWRVWYRILGNVWLIFFPLVIIYKLVKGRNISEQYKNAIKASWWFLIYLFVTNAIITMHDVFVGNKLVTIPEGADKFKVYYLLFLELLPFNGLVNLITYLISSFKAQIILSLL